jgi:hypothetical protein
VSAVAINKPIQVGEQVDFPHLPTRGGDRGHPLLWLVHCSLNKLANPEMTDPRFALPGSVGADEGPHRTHSELTFTRD